MKAGIALGSNLGNRTRHIARGLEFLKGLSTGHFLVSSVIETAPVDCPEGSDAFLNAVAEIDYAGPARSLFERLKAFEREEGRRETERNAPRPLDLDLLYFGAERIDSSDLIVPHPRMATRRFVLAPLAEIAPGLVLPGKNATITELLHAL